MKNKEKSEKRPGPLLEESDTSDLEDLLMRWKIIEAQQREEKIHSPILGTSPKKEPLIRRKDSKTGYSSPRTEKVVHTIPRLFITKPPVKTKPIETVDKTKEIIKETPKLSK